MPTTITSRVTDAAAGGQTARIAAAPAGGQTSRLHSLLLLEGDQSGYLLLDGDAQGGTDKLQLEGDQSPFAIGGTTTQRIAGAVT